MCVQDATEQKAVFIGTESRGFSVKESLPKGARGNKWKYGIVMETKERQFAFLCERKEEQKEWVEALKLVMAKPMQPQDYTSKSQHTAQLTQSQMY